MNQNLHITIHAIAQTSDLNAPMITDLVSSVLRSCHIHVSSVELTKVESSAVLSKRLPRKIKGTQTTAP